MSKFHKSHKIRTSDSSVYDLKCKYCGKTDEVNIKEFYKKCKASKRQIEYVDYLGKQDKIFDYIKEYCTKPERVRSWIQVNELTKKFRIKGIELLDRVEDMKAQGKPLDILPGEKDNKFGDWLIEYYGDS